jgi:hypothetical protein
MTKYILNNDYKNWQPYVDFRSAIDPKFVEANFKLENICLYDRFGIVENPPDVKIIRPFVAIQNNKSFDELCLDRARELDTISIEQNKPLLVTWSGGLDSTCVLSALMQTITDTNRLKILCTKESIAEYPLFFKNFIENKYEVMETNWASFKAAINTLCLTNILITGEAADQLFDEVAQNKYEPTPVHNMMPNYSMTDHTMRGYDRSYMFRESRKGPWQVALNQENKTYWDMVENFVDKSPKKINNLRDFLFVFRLNYRYQHVQTRILMMTDNLRLEDNLFHFFDTNEFNNFSMNMDLEIFDGDNIVKTKRYIREFICKYTFDFEYYNTKEKSPSLGVKEYPLTTRYSKLDESWNRYV